MGHLPMRIRSIRKDAQNNKKYNQIDFGFPYHLVTCTVEWYPQRQSEGSVIYISDSRLNYEEVR